MSAEGGARVTSTQAKSAAGYPRAGRTRWLVAPGPFPPSGSAGAASSDRVLPADEESPSSAGNAGRAKMWGWRSLRSLKRPWRMIIRLAP
jgi:hypothetical protein